MEPRGPFANPNNGPDASAVFRPHSGPQGSIFWGGFDGTPTGPGHGHGSGLPGGERPAVSDMLGNVALRGAGVEVLNQPRW
jgi:hypothetical protein